MSHLHKVVGFAALLAVGCNSNGLLKTQTAATDGGCQCGPVAGSGAGDGGSGNSGGSDNGGGAGSGGVTDGGVPCTPADAGTAVQPPVYTRDWVVSTTGSDNGAGTAASPFRTINRGIQAASAGERVLVMPGTYAERVTIDSSVRSGTADKPIRLQGQGMPKIVPGDDSWAMVYLQRSYWQMDGFEIDAQGTSHVAVSFANTQGDWLTHSHLHHGTSIGGVSLSGNATGIHIENNEIDHFWRTPIDDSHGIGIEWTVKDVTIRHNVIHENSGDSVQCEGPETYADGATPADGILIEGNEMYGDFEQSVDIKTCSNVRVVNNWMHDYTQYPGGCSMVIHMSASNVTVEDNRFYNVGNAIAIGGNHIGPVPFNVVVRRNRIWSVHKNPDHQMEGAAIILENSEQAQILNNTIWDADFAAIKAGGCDQGDTSNMVSRNNILAPVSGGYAYYFGICMAGLDSGPNLFAPNARISDVNGNGGREALSLATWQLSGHDQTSRVADPQLNPDTLAPGSAAVDWGADLGLPYCGEAPDLGAVETGCPAVVTCN